MRTNTHFKTLPACDDISSSSSCYAVITDHSFHTPFSLFYQLYLQKIPSSAIPPFLLGSTSSHTPSDITIRRCMFTGRRLSREQVVFMTRIHCVVLVNITDWSIIHSLLAKKNLLRPRNNLSNGGFPHYIDPHMRTFG